MCVCLCACVYAYVCIHSCLTPTIRISPYTCMCVCMHTCTLDTHGKNLSTHLCVCMHTSILKTHRENRSLQIHRLPATTNTTRAKRMPISPYIKRLLSFTFRACMCVCMCMHTSVLKPPTWKIALCISKGFPQLQTPPGQHACQYLHTSNVYYPSHFGVLFPQHLRSSGLI
jgi:hypothetical protein